ncbi:MAG: peptide-methionine (S)-S-oxide reductase MsrA [Alphaproteobacteria bacterium]|jgi:peptide-methionine (S)-S-oxide reductase|nr:peptide-methionine (S)-S-oxide reductase MsrA [Alphaproteobacteria bacterium]MDP6568018.1 peptide-methionine (S)-S-oxide reductase MsrA [Alphaproteobacteria bacterium]MDP6813485.1 peptide-methionine (S)-S-oxide reductase MsrA [Alphaproteobacteria bacterium]
MISRPLACLAAALVAIGLGGGALAVQPSPSRAAVEGEAVAIFAGGCFWCVESDFDGVPGVTRTISGYTGGSLKDPTYRQVTAGGTGHREAVQIFYDPGKVDFEGLLEVFWRSVDPTDKGGQFCDRGDSYQTAIYVTSPEQRRLAEASRNRLRISGLLDRPVVTPIEDAGPFYPAETYHQDYYRKNPLRYKLYRYGCGRDARVQDLWGEQAHRGIAKH